MTASWNQVDLGQSPCPNIKIVEVAREYRGQVLVMAQVRWRGLAGLDEEDKGIVPVEDGNGGGQARHLVCASGILVFHFLLIIFCVDSRILWLCWFSLCIVMLFQAYKQAWPWALVLRWSYLSQYVSEITNWKMHYQYFEPHSKHVPEDGIMLCVALGGLRRTLDVSWRHFRRNSYCPTMVGNFEPVRGSFVILLASLYYASKR